MEEDQVNLEISKRVTRLVLSESFLENETLLHQLFQLLSVSDVLS